jgi:hypothetical protein
MSGNKSKKPDNAKKEFYREVDITLDKIRPPSAFRHSTMGRMNEAVSERGRQANELVGRMPVLLERYARMIATQQAKPVIYSAEEVAAKLEEILNQHGTNPMALKRAVQEWLGEVRLTPDNGDIVEDKMPEGWET